MPSAVSRPFTNGVYCPLITPFVEGTEEIDYDAWNKQILRLAQAGMGLVLLGTNGEASHLSDEERVGLIKAARTTLDANNFSQVPLLVGTGTGSAKETIKITKQAAEAGADYSIVIAPGYFAFAYGKNRAALKDYFVEVIEKSPIPIMIYSFPAASSGIELDSDLLIELSELPNCFGTKLTCAGIGKGHRIAVHTQSEAYLARHGPFQVLPGFSDYLFPALVARHTGSITGTGNVIPKTIVKLYDTAIKAIETGDPALFKEAQKLQDIVSEADWVIVKAGIGGTKYALDKFVAPGLGGVPRKPLPIADDATRSLIDRGMKAAIAFENSL